VKLLKDTFIRRRFVLHDYFCQTNTFKECWLVLKCILTFKPLSWGGDIRKYEELAAKTMGSKYACSYASGRMALYAILKSLGIGEGDEVLVQGFTCVAVPRAVLYTGAHPVYFDIDRDTFNVDYTGIQNKITKRTKAVIVQHTFGNIADVEKVREIINNYNKKQSGDVPKDRQFTESPSFLDRINRQKIYIIEDFAHTVGCGKLKGDVGFYFSDHTKMISTSTGGMAFTNDEEIMLNLDTNWFEYSFLPTFKILQIAFTFMVETIITHPKVYWLLRPLRILLDKIRVFFFFRDENRLSKPKEYPLRLSNLQAAIGISQLNRLPSYFKKMRQFSIFPLRDVYVIEDDRVRERYKDKFKENYVVSGVWFNSLVFGCKDLSTVYYEDGSCPVAEDVWAIIVGN